MGQTGTRKTKPEWVSELEGLEADLYDASDNLSGGEGLQLPEMDEAEYVAMDSMEKVEDRPLGTDGIFHCVGVVVEGEEVYLGHVTPGEAGRTAEEVLYGVETEVKQVTYALGGSPDLDLLEDTREQFNGTERIVYTGRNGNIAVDPDGEIYSFNKKEERGPLSTTL